MIRATVVCQFGAMFFPDKVKAYKEARRVLKPGGRYFFNVCDKIADNAFADVVTQAVGEMFPDDPPLFLARTPHGHHDEARIRGDLTAAGFSDIAAEAKNARNKATSPREAAIAFCEGTPLRNEIEARDKLACRRPPRSQPMRLPGALAPGRPTGASAPSSSPR